MNLSIGRAVVTGASGFLGRRLCSALAARGYEVVPWTRAVVDLEDALAVAALLTSTSPELVFHLAAASVDAARAHDVSLIAREVSMTAALVDAMQSPARLVIAGSMSEYGAPGILCENAACTPQTAYGIAKLASGQYASAYGADRKLDVRRARLFGLYGPGESSHRLFPTLVEALREKRPVRLSDGLQRRDFIHVDDAAAALVSLAEIKAGRDTGLMNIGTGVGIAVRDAAIWIADMLGASRDLLQFGARPRSPGDADLICADVARMRALTGKVPEQRLRQGLDMGLFT